MAALLAARLLAPTEGADRGDTLPYAQLWLGALVVWAWDGVRRGGVRVRFGWCDAPVLLLAGGHVLSALVLLARHDGNQRAAVNMLWEWTALYAGFFLVRQTVRTRDEVRRILLTLTVLAAAVAALGLYQHFAWYPRVAERYTEVRGELDRLLPAGHVEPVTRETAQRIEELRRELREMGAPPAGPERALWEQRLLFSSEPLGFFGLANTLGGLLAVWLIVAAAVLAATSPPVLRGGAPGRLLGLLLLIVLLGLCLALTKSRTAWVGLAAGLVVWGGAWLWRRRTSQGSGIRGQEPGVRDQKSGDRAQRWLIAGLVGLVLAGGVVAVSGGLDREVISEAPQSIRYRLQYWNGAWQVIRQRPLVGAGPGNFRQHYLQHKLPESSELILDPHNLLLDVWTSGGILALAGILGVIAAAVVMLLRATSNGEEVTVDELTVDGVPDDSRSASDRQTRDRQHVNRQPSTRFLLSPLVLGAVPAFGVVAAVNWLSGEPLQQNWLLGVLGGGALLAVLAARSFSTWRFSPIVPLAAFAALVVNLLGAGGAEMPAVMQALLLLLAVAAVSETRSGVFLRGDGKQRRHQQPPSATKKDSRRPRSPEPPTPRRGALLAVLGISVVLFAAAFASATRPVLLSRLAMQSGEYALAEEHRPRLAFRLFVQAAEADPLSPQPVRRLAELRLREWQSSPGDEDAFHDAVALQNSAIELDPHYYRDYRGLGEMYLMRSGYLQQSKQQAARAAERAVEAYREAVERYPTGAWLRGELAVALAAAGRSDEAARQARRALKLDEINRREGHVDKLLGDEQRRRLRELTGAVTSQQVRG